MAKNKIAVNETNNTRGTCTTTENQVVKNKVHFDISPIIAILSFILAVCSFLIATFPQINPFNNNIVAKAEAGDLKSQIMLAEHYYEIVDISESIYWYKIASAQESYYQAAALNNLAVIYANSDPIIEWDSYVYIKAYKIFLKAGDLGETAALRNAYILLHAVPEDVFCSNGINPSMEKSRLRTLLTTYNEWSEELEGIDYNLKYVANVQSLTEFSNTYDKNFYKASPAYTQKVVIKKNDDGMDIPVIETYTTYNVFEILGESELPEYKYIHISESY